MARLEGHECELYGGGAEGMKFNGSSEIMFSHRELNFCNWLENDFEANK
jgi:hypothetical protein